MTCKYKYNNNWYSEEEVKKEITKNISKDDLVLSLLQNYSYTVEINTAKIAQKNIDDAYAEQYGFSETGIRPWNQEEENDTQYYSNLTVPGGTNGSYIEANIETPLITPSIKGHSQFSTDNSIGWYRMDEKQNYREQDIDNLLKIMENSGILKINCS